MAKKAYVGVSGASKNVTNIYVGVGGVPKKVVKGYVGVNGVPKLFWEYDGDGFDFYVNINVGISEGIIAIRVNSWDSSYLNTRSNGLFNSDFTEITRDLIITKSESLVGVSLIYKGTFTRAGNDFYLQGRESGGSTYFLAWIVGGVTPFRYGDEFTYQIDVDISVSKS